MTPDQLHQELQQSEWISNFDERTLQRAADYVRRRRVTELRFGNDSSADNCVIEGTVRGSQRQPYRSRVEVERHGSWLTLATTCSCPVGDECKHAAAILLVAANLPPAAWPGAPPEARRKKARGVKDPSKAEELVQRLLDAGLHEHAEKLRKLTSQRQGLAASQLDMRSWSEWLQRMQPLPVPRADAAQAKRQFGLLLRGSTEHDELLVNPVWLRPGKSANGHLVDPKPLLLDDFRGPVPAPDAGWPAGIAGALAVLCQAPDQRIAGHYWTTIQALHQEQALETVADVYPVFFEKGAVPLTRGPNLPLQARWHSLADGSQRLRAELEADHAHGEAPLLLRGTGLWYVLPHAGRFGKIEGERALLDGIESAPAVLPEQVDALCAQLQHKQTSPPIPLPEPRPPVRPLRVSPTPMLELRLITLPTSQGRGRPQQTRMGCARLSFDYGGHLLAPASSAPGLIHSGMRGGSQRVLVKQAQIDGQTVANQVFDIARDAATESRAERQLADSGLVNAVYYGRQLGMNRSALEAQDLLLPPQPRNPQPIADRWAPLIEQWEAAGFRVSYKGEFPRDQLVEIDQWHAEVSEDGGSWFDLALGVDIDGERLDLLPILRRLLLDPAFPRRPAKGEKNNATWRVLLDENRSAQMPLARLRALIEPLLEWLETEGDLRLHLSQAPMLAALDSQLHWRGGKLLRAQLSALESARKPASIPHGFTATLRPYQRDGLAWLDFLGSAGVGGILADDMGLGKTVQVLAHILAEKQRGKLEQPALVVAPTSLVGNWLAETRRFAPTLKVLVIHGADRADRYDEIADHDLVITTYPLLPRDRERLIEQRFALLVLDEAQAIKNPASQAARVVREIPATRRLAMTGTPLENHLGELWAQFDVVEPGLLGNQRQFTKLYRTPIEKHGDAERQQRLNRRVAPLLLRRRKDDVLTELPAKTDIVRTLELHGEQRALYETLRLAQHERVRQAMAERGLSQSGIIVLDALLKLRQACCDPRLVKLESAKKITASAKLDALLELLDGLLDEGRRVLLFSQFTEMLALIEMALKKRKVAYQILTGQTPARDRTALVERFQTGDVPVFLISLKAGGVGLNLTAADTVIHYDPWWNPAAEAQATDRAHRIGQDKPVFVYRLICTGTVEEKIQAMQSRKAELARAVLDGGGSTQQLRFNETDVAELFAPM